jgi:hypothetical protein
MLLFIWNRLGANLHKMKNKITDITETCLPKVTKRWFVLLVVIRNQKKKITKTKLKFVLLIRASTILLPKSPHKSKSGPEYACVYEGNNFYFHRCIIGGLKLSFVFSKFFSSKRGHRLI